MHFGICQLSDNCFFKKVKESIKALAYSSLTMFCKIYNTSILRT